jgi:hypothetical protein
LKSPEFHGYRTGLLVAFAAFVGLGTLLVGASIVSDVFFHRERNPQPLASLGQCRADVTGLLARLGEAKAALELDAVKGEAGDLPARWDEFAQKWQSDWEGVNERCGFRARVDTGLGEAYDRLAHVHENLDTTRLKYAALLSRFAREVLPDVTQMRSALTRVNNQ